jgi:hypothetical protein
LEVRKLLFDDIKRRQPIAPGRLLAIRRANRPRKNVLYVRGGSLIELVVFVIAREPLDAGVQRFESMFLADAIR